MIEQSLFSIARKISHLYFIEIRIMKRYGGKKPPSWAVFLCAKNQKRGNIQSRRRAGLSQGFSFGKIP
jgi:hypothetical protein